MKSWFVAESLHTVITDPRIEHATFCDYWWAKAGADARKLDWPCHLAQLDAQGCERRLSKHLPQRDCRLQAQHDRPADLPGFRPWPTSTGSRGC